MKLILSLLVACLPLLAQKPISPIERVSSGYAFTEGPAWSPEGYLVFSDIPNNKIIKITTDGLTVYREDSQGANGNAFDSRGRLYTCEGRARRVTRTDKNGKVEVMAERFEGKRFNAPNDIVVRRDGNVYFTDPAFGNQADTREMDYYGVYHIDTKGSLTLIAKPKGRPNGVTLSPDGRILYVANSDERNIRAYDLDRSGRASGERIVVSGIDGPPDGIRTDVKGNLYVTAKALVIYSPKGELIETIAVPETPANCTFGDDDMQTLYITARTTLYKVRMEEKGSVQH